MNVLKIVEEVLNQAPVAYNPELQTLKGWVLFCLRDRGFKVVTSPKADLVIETVTDRLYFNVGEQLNHATADINWIVRDAMTGRVQVVIAATNSEG